MQGSGPKGDDVLQNTGEFQSVRLCGKIDPCAQEEGVKGLRALGVRVPGPGMVTARDGRSLVRTVGNSPLCSIGLRPLRIFCAKGEGEN